MLVRDVMQQDVITARPDTMISEVAQLMKVNDIGAVAIVDGDSLEGIVTDRDLVVKHLAAGHTHDCPVREAMTGIISAGDVARELRQALNGLMAEGEKAATDSGTSETMQTTGGMTTT